MSNYLIRYSSAYMVKIVSCPHCGNENSIDQHHVSNWLLGPGTEPTDVSRLCCNNPTCLKSFAVVLKTYVHIAAQVTRAELLEQLRNEIDKIGKEKATQLLLEYLDDKEIKEAYGIATGKEV